MSRSWKVVAVVSFLAAVTGAEAAWSQAGDLSGITCPSATEEPPKAPMGVVWRRPADYVRYWPETWICQPRVDAVANLWLAQVKQEAWNGETYYALESSTPPEASSHPRWVARLSWKILVSARRADRSPASLLVKVEYEQPSLARFDMFVSLTAKGVRGTAARVLGEAASEACLRVRNDCKHVEEIVLEVPRDALRGAVGTGLLIDIAGHGRTERLGIGKEVIWALGERAGLR